MLYINQAVVVGDFLEAFRQKYIIYSILVKNILLWTFYIILLIRIISQLQS